MARRPRAHWYDSPPPSGPVVFDPSLRRARDLVAGSTPATGTPATGTPSTGTPSTVAARATGAPTGLGATGGPTATGDPAGAGRIRAGRAAGGGG